MGFKFNPLTGELDLVGTSQAAQNPNILDVIAGETISALRLVYQDEDQVFLASSNQDHRPIGVAISAGNSGQNIQVQTFGELKDSSFSFLSNQTLFLGLAGAISSTPPLSGFNVEIGYGQGTGEIFINIKNQIVL